MDAENIVISSVHIDYSRLVGREIHLRTEQFPSHLLATRVMALTDNYLVIDRSGSCGRIDQLVAGQKIEVLFDYKGEPVKFQSVLLIPRIGRLQIPIAGEVCPELQRQFLRLRMEHDVRLTFFDETNIGHVRLNKLKWLETSTVNIGGGGMLVRIPTFIGSEGYMALHLGLNEIELPTLLVGRIRHRQHPENTHNQVGVEFIIRESCAEKLPRNLIRNLPLKMFDFDKAGRMTLAEYLTEKYNKIISIEGNII
ncbi:hypothetical protein TRIP_C60521 [Candidatus Zixiibacteriota bacterium]|nr:hypothetical protein TRIP_C60521 [candidate division Zixibacteria bacterium]